MPEPSPIDFTDGTYIECKTVEDMTNDELDTLIAQRRERRLRSFKVYEQAEESKRRAKDERLKAKLGKQIDIMKKELDRADAALDKLDKRITVIAGIRLELEDYV